jgi:hypothetical protein
MGLLFSLSIQNLKSKIQNLLNDSVRSRQYIRRNCQADLLGGLIDDKLEFG